jgi:hypothetical protein
VLPLYYTSIYSCVIICYIFQAIICELDGIHPVANAWPSATIDKLKTLLVPPTAENQKLYKVIAVSKCEQIYKVKITDDSSSKIKTIVKLTPIC